MPIEIKELHIRVKVEDDRAAGPQALNINEAFYEPLIAKLVKDCTNKVLEKLKEREEK
jgi:hypothetical protein